MATTWQIQAQLAAFIRSAMFAMDLPGPNAIVGYTGQIQIFNDYPTSPELDQLLTTGSVAIAVTSMGDSVSTKRFPVVDKTMTVPASPVTALISGTTITLSGFPTPPLNLAIVVNGDRAFTQQVVMGDTLTALAGRFAADMTAFGATAIGPVISFTSPSVTEVEVRSGVYVSTRREIGRQRSHFRVTIWCQDEDVRNGAVYVVRGALDDLRRFVDLDNWGVNISAGREVSLTDALRIGWSRTEILYPVEFGVTIGGEAPTVMFVTLAQAFVDPGTSQPVVPDHDLPAVIMPQGPATEIDVQLATGGFLLGG